MTELVKQANNIPFFYFNLINNLSNMFDLEFYPTPEEVVDRMIGGYSLHNKVILEPHAGSGSMIDALRKYMPSEIIACEKHPELAVITKEKADRFLRSDFLTTTSEEISHIHFIIANPPFSKSIDHVLHMWEIAPPGCIILTLGNYDTYYDAERYWHSRGEKFKILGEIINEHGKLECFGKAFENADRKTDCTIGFLHLQKPGSANEHEFDGYFDLTEEQWPDTQGEGVIRYNSIQAIVNSVVASVKMFDSVLEANRTINGLMGSISGNITFGCFLDKERINRERFKKELQRNAWRKVFAEMNMNKHVTSSVRETLNRFVENQREIPFTFANVFRMIEMIMGTRNQRMDGMLIEAFDKICSFSHANSTAGEKWKTNSNYKVNRVFIHDYICEWRKDYTWTHECVHLNYRSNEYINDIIKALCYLTGFDYDKTTPLDYFVRQNKVPWGKWVSWGFFEIKGHKKGTMHFKFADEDLWIRFNKTVGKLKGWVLPEETDNKKTGRERTKTDGVELFVTEDW